jgi:hypothetical protein
MRRILIGLLALLFLGAAVALHFSDFENSVFLLSVCMKVGLVLGAMWFAYDQVLKISQRSPPWLLGIIGVSLLVIVIRPKAFVIVGPLLAAIALLQCVGWLFKPLPKPRKTPRKDGPT